MVNHLNGIYSAMKIPRYISNDKNPNAEKGVFAAHPNGHFYSPVVDPATLTSKAQSIWATETPQIAGIDFNRKSHEMALTSWFPRHMPEYDYPESVDAERGETQFYTRNSQFSWLDSRTLFVFLKQIRPARLIEIGSGYSSLLTADVNQRFLNGSCNFQCIEPYPRDFLVAGVAGISELITRKVQDVPLNMFEKLQRGDILFIDSSHVCKTGSDVNFLYFEVLPRLKSGVMIHIHDIFLPFEYPMEWVLDENRSWNEQYLLRALLMYSDTFRVFFACYYASEEFPELVSKALDLPSGLGFGGGSFWLEKA